MKRTERLYREKREFHLPWNNIKCCRLQWRMEVCRVKSNDCSRMMTNNRLAPA
jgi:hypothetical protein